MPDTCALYRITVAASGVLQHLPPAGLARSPASSAPHAGQAPPPDLPGLAERAVADVFASRPTWTAWNPQAEAEGARAARRDPPDIWADGGDAAGGLDAAGARHPADPGWHGRGDQVADDLVFGDLRQCLVLEAAGARVADVATSPAA
jgi:hypothetical protein